MAVSGTISDGPSAAVRSLVLSEAIIPGFNNPCSLGIVTSTSSLWPSGDFTVKRTVALVASAATRALNVATAAASAERSASRICRV